MESSQILKNQSASCVPYSIASAFKTNGIVNVASLNVMKNPAHDFNSKRVHFDINGNPKSKLIPIDFLPKTSINVDSIAKNYSAYLYNKTLFSKASLNLSPYVTDCMNKRGLTVKNYKFWSGILKGLLNNAFFGVPASEFEAILNTTYFESPPRYGEYPLNLESFMLKLDESVIRERDTSYSQNIFDSLALSPQHIQRIKTGYDVIFTGNSNLILDSEFSNYESNDVLFGVFLKSKYLKEFYNAYESQRYNNTRINDIEGKFAENFKVVGDSYNSLDKEVSYDPKWFTVIYDKDKFKTFRDKKSDYISNILKSYKQTVIKPLLESGVDVISESVLFCDLAKPLNIDIISRLPNGLLNYEKESRDFLSKISKINI